MLNELVTKTRSYRRFHQERTVELETLRELVELARLSASGANLQPLKYILACDRETNTQIFPLLKWAGYLRDWDGPTEGERPAAYIVILNDTQIRPDPGVDPGIVAQSIMLGATEKGLGGCMIASVDRPTLRDLLAIPDRFKISLVLALGVPKEEVVIEAVGPDGDIKYYRDAAGVHHLPKRALKDLILAEH